MKKSTANKILNGERLPAIISNKAKVSLPPVPSNVVLEVLDSAIDKKREKRHVYWARRSKDDTIVHIEKNSKRFYKSYRTNK